MKLYYSENINPRLAVAVARHLGSPVAFVKGNVKDEAVRAEVRRLSPVGLFPILEEDDGSALWETDAIACRLSQLEGSDFWREGAEQPDMIRWISWATHHLNREADKVLWERVTKQKYGMGPPDEAVVAEGLEGVGQHMPVLERALDGRDWLCGDRLSYADFRAGTMLRLHEEAGLPLADYPNAAAWHDRLMALPAWADPFDGLD